MAQAQEFWRRVWGDLWGRQGQQGQGQQQQPQQPQQEQQRQPVWGDRARGGHAAGPRQMNMFQEHAAMQRDMYAATNQAWANEMASRKKIAQAERDRQHEYEMEALRQQGAREQAAQEQQQRQSANPMENDEFRQARNRQLLGMAGFGGHTLHIDGQGNKTRTPHPFGNSPFARSLLG